jgi:hypothetical protein
MSAGSRASIIGSQSKSVDNKDFIQLDDIDIQVENGISILNRDEFVRGLNQTRIERGSVHSEDDTVLLPIQGTQGIPAPTLSRSTLGPGGNNRGSGWNQGIKVKKDYSVTVEISPDPPSPSSSGERVNHGAENSGPAHITDRRLELDVESFGREGLGV